MSERIQKQRPRPKERETEQAVEPKKSDAREKLPDIDEVLDEIDDILEENAEQFVKDYVQQGGE